MNVNPKVEAEFGRQVRGRREALGLTRKELAHRVGCSIETIRKIESGERHPSMQIAELLAKHLDIVPDQRSAFIVSARKKSPMGNLPTPLTSFIGRGKEIAELMERMKTTRLLTLTGAGGCGKTRLAIEVTHQSMDTFADGVWWVEFAPLQDGALVPQAVVKALNARETPQQPLIEALIGHVRDKHLLLVLDNCEHLLDACAQLTETLLRACPRLTVLATSREAVNITGEVTWLVPPLSLPAQNVPSPSQLLQAESVRLFCERTVGANSSFMLTEHNAPAVEQICRRLDGIPLALELAAACVKVLSVEQIAARLDDRFRLLTEGSRTALPRQQTLRATVDWSYSLLNDAERTLFRRLAVFVGGWTLEAAERVAGDSQNVLESLFHLVEKSLVIAEQRQGAVRYRMLETIREYACDMLRTQGANEEHALRRRHLDFYIALAEAAERKLHSVEAAQWLMQLEAERDNFRTAIDWSFAHGETTSGLHLVGALDSFWDLRAFSREQRAQLLKAVAKSDPSERTSLRAKVLNQAAKLQWFFRHYDEARALVEEALSIGIELGDQRNLAESFHCLDYLAYAQKDYRTSDMFCEKALAIWRELGDTFRVASTLRQYALTSEREGNYERAQNLYEEAIGLLTELGETRDKAVALRRLGRVALRQGDDTKAAALCQQCLKVSFEAGYEHEVGSCLATIGGIAVARGQSVRAAQLFGAAEALLEELDTLMLFGDVYDYEDDLSALRAQLDEATLEAAWADGRAMTLEQAVAYALAPVNQQSDC